MLGGLPRAVSAPDETAAGSPPSCRTTHAPQGQIGRQTDRVAQPRGPSLCRSVVPLIGFATPQWALGAAMPSSTHSNIPGAAGGAGRPGNGGMLSIPTCHEVKAARSRQDASQVRTGAVWQQQNRFQRGWLMRPQQCGRHLRGNLEGVPPGEIRGLWIAQASNRWPERKPALRRSAQP